MREISVKEARQRFREVLDRVEKGEEIVVLRRGRPVARLVPPEQKGKRLPSLSELRRSIAQEGTPSVELLREERDAR